ncbi:hypothetical protein E2C01_003081 [Portunus trituberculatus]|uniref:Uncharacterized protein n=1 Tax=Portunus trituberculatus TaxID=210409 RepID=A0A5B7CQ24_PORTR|nr:hypothetical protein [Portunus trituberculatus]
MYKKCVEETGSEERSRDKLVTTLYDNRHRTSTTTTIITIINTQYITNINTIVQRIIIITTTYATNTHNTNTKRITTFTLFRVNLRKSDPSVTMFGHDESNLIFEVIHHEDYHLQIKLWKSKCGWVDKIPESMEKE